MHTSAPPSAPLQRVKRFALVLPLQTTDAVESLHRLLLASFSVWSLSDRRRVTGTSHISNKQSRVAQSELVIAAVNIHCGFHWNANVGLNMLLLLESVKRRPPVAVLRVRWG